MKKEMIFSICIILVAIIGVGCVSAADNITTDMNDPNQITINQNTEQVYENNNPVSENNDVDNIITQNSSNTTQDISENSQNTIINEDNICINTSEPDKLVILTEDDDGVVPGNGFSAEEVKQINKFSKFYKDHNYSLEDLFKEVYPYLMTSNNKGNLEYITKFITVIHNVAMAERGYGTLYDNSEMQDKLFYLFAELILKF